MLSSAARSAPTGLLGGKSTLQQRLSASQQLPPPSNNGVRGLTPTFYYILHYSRWWLARNYYEWPESVPQFRAAAGHRALVYTLLFTDNLFFKQIYLHLLMAVRIYSVITRYNDMMGLCDSLWPTGAYVISGFLWSGQRSDFYNSNKVLRWQKSSVWGVFVVDFLTFPLEGLLVLNNHYQFASYPVFIYIFIIP